MAGGGGTPTVNGPLQHYKSGRASNDMPDAPLGRSPLRPTNSSAAGSMAFDGDGGDLAKSARMKVRILVPP